MDLVIIGGAAAIGYFHGRIAGTELEFDENGKKTMGVLGMATWAGICAFLVT